MDKHQEMEDLYQTLLRRNQINAEIIRKYKKKTNQFHKRNLPPPIFILGNKNDDELFPELEPIPHSNTIPESEKTVSQKEQSNIFIKQEVSEDEVIKKETICLPSIANSSNLMNKPNREEKEKDEVCLSGYNYPLSRNKFESEKNILMSVCGTLSIQKSKAKVLKVMRPKEDSFGERGSCQTFMVGFGEENNLDKFSSLRNEEKENNFTEKRCENIRRLHRSLLKNNITDNLRNQRAESIIPLKKEIKTNSSQKALLNMQDIVFESNKSKEKENLMLKELNKIKKTNNMISSHKNKKFECPGFYENSKHSVFDSLSNITNLVNRVDNGNGRISLSSCGKIKTFSSNSFSALSSIRADGVIREFGSEKKNILDAKKNTSQEKTIICKENSLMNQENKNVLRQNNKPIIQILALPTLNSARELILSEVKSEKPDTLIPNIKRLKELKSNFSKFLIKENSENCPYSYGYTANSHNYRNINSSQSEIKVPMTSSIQENFGDNFYLS